MQSRRHVESLVVIVGALDVNEAGGRIGANHSQEVGKTHAAKIAEERPGAVKGAFFAASANP
jgi:hypothetical protein